MKHGDQSSKNPWHGRKIRPVCESYPPYDPPEYQRWEEVLSGNRLGRTVFVLVTQTKTTHLYYAWGDDQAVVQIELTKVGDDIYQISTLSFVSYPKHFADLKRLAKQLFR